ncbi:MAG: hypothetical protein IJB07_00655 [Firmicutes bacterium]|nr:hypothetical protein [Bacillota bacterium]MBR2000979.1 hypothetical protein [Bacillota bacterium]MBR7149192.1 hypothetical protein [Bacillota bacterium]
MHQNIDERLLLDLAEQIGLSSDSTANHRSSDSRSQAMAAAEAMKGKSDQEILAEIMKLKSVLQKDPASYEKQIRAVKALRGMMNPEQRQRLDRLLQLLER